MGIHARALVSIDPPNRAPHRDSWQRDLAEGAHSLSDLVQQNYLTEEMRSLFENRGLDHRICVSRYYLSLIDRQNPRCPIRAQAIPHPKEVEGFAWDQEDPIGDDAHRVSDILVHRYVNRVLLFPTHACPLSCRYCFRKVAINDGPLRLHRALPDALDYLRAQSEVNEVILSGGDPFMLADGPFGRLLAAIDDVETVDTVRIHSRVPATLPSRITPELIGHLGASRTQTILVTHFNHPKELTPQALDGLNGLWEAGVLLANQSVLLKGVNDDADTLMNLFNGLLKANVRPYYLHHLDPAPGTAHFRLSLEAGLSLYRQLCRKVSGLARPRYVMEYPGGGGKMDVDSRAIRPLDAEGRYELTAPVDGRTMVWTDPAYQ